MPPITSRTSPDAPPPRSKKRSAALSCAECRRLKLRCDRKFPCGACIKRGCSAICPDGSLTTGKGNRFVLANTERLHDKIAELSNRVRELEDALNQSHSIISADQHPLLRDDLLNIKNPLERDMSQDDDEDPEENDAVDTLGSLSISNSGHANFFGHTANSWYLLQNEEGEDISESEEQPSPLPTDIPWLSHTFPFSAQVGPKVEDVRRTVVGLLPPAAEAREVANRYYEFASWMYEPISKAHFEESIFLPVYQSPNAGPDVSEAHRISVLFAVLAIGTLMDLNLPRDSPKAAQYYQLSRAAIALDSVLESPSETAIQALILMCHYLFLTESHSARWTIMGIICKLCQSVGLHRDSSRWNMPEDESQRRREIMWEAFTYDAFQCLTFGRPPSFSVIHVDCKMPYATSTNSNGQVEMSYHAWKHRFASECLHPVLDQIFGAKTPSYATVIELDKKVRNYYVPPSLQVPGFGRMSTLDTEPPALQLTFQRHIIFAIRESTILYMHRGFFARAMEEHPDDPLGSRYGQSVLSAHRSASSFIALMQSFWLQYKDLTERLWFLFTHAFSAAILLGSIPVRCPSMGFSRSALQSLEQACDLFSNLQDASKSAKIIPILHRLRDRARISMTDYHSGRGMGSINSQSQAKRDGMSDSVQKQEDEEFATLSGKTRFVSPKDPPSRASPSSSHQSTHSEAYHSPKGLQVQTPLRVLPSQMGIPETPPIQQPRGGIERLEPLVMQEYFPTEMVPLAQQPLVSSSQHAQSHMRWQPEVAPHSYADMTYQQQQHQHQQQQHQLQLSLERERQREQLQQHHQRQHPQTVHMMTHPQQHPHPHSHPHPHAHHHHQPQQYLAQPSYYDQVMYASPVQQISTGIPALSPHLDPEPEASWRNWVAQFGSV